MDKQVVILTADESYTGMTHTQILYAEFLAKSMPVVFIEAPKAWHPFRFLSLLIAPEQMSAHLQVLTYVNVLPARNSIFRKLNEWANAAKLLITLRKQKATQLLIWHFDSFRSVLNSKKIQATYLAKHIYHVIDPFYGNPVDAVLCKISDVIVITSPRNKDAYRDFSTKTIIVPQCLDLKEINRLLSSKYDINFSAPYFVMLGTVSDDTDFLTLIEVAKKVGALVIIGKILPLKTKQQQFLELKSLMGVYFTGMLRPNEFYPILKHANAGLICYDLRVRANNFSPLKAVNYLVAGIPVISNCTTELSTLINKAVYESTDASDIVNLCIRQLSGHLYFDNEAVKQWSEANSIEVAVTNILNRI